MDGEPQADNQQIVRGLYRASFFIFLFLLSIPFQSFPDAENDTAPASVEEWKDALVLEKEAIGNVSFGINVTNPLPAEINSQVRQLYTTDISRHFYHNITGLFRGSWTSHTVDNDPSTNTTLLEEKRGEFLFDQGGSFMMNLKSIKTQNDDIYYIEGHLRLKDIEKSDAGTLLLAEGFHYLSNGSIYLVGAPEGRALHLEELLHMLPTNASLVTTQTLIMDHIDRRLKEIDDLSLTDSQLWEDRDNHLVSVKYDCPMRIFAQLKPISESIKISQLVEYEKELENPQGITTIKPPALELSSVMYSTECGLAITMTDASGMKIETYFNKAGSYATMATAIAIAQTFLLIHQMEYTPTPSSVTNVSYWTIAMQALMDGYICLIHLTTGVVMENVFLPFASAAFFSFILVAIFGMRYLLVIRRIQRPEANRSQAQQDGQPSTFFTTYMDFNRLYYVLLFGLFIFFKSTTHSPLIQNIVIALLGCVFYSFWIPQIVRNVMRGCRKPLSPRYVLGMTATRLITPLYVYACPDNILAQDPVPSIWLLVVYLVMQVVVLFLQDLLGPRFFVPEKYLPQTYNYHPLVPPEDEETSHEHSHHLQPRDCAICMLPVDTSGAVPTGLHVLGRIQYMMTPCHHLFHTECLEKWMKIKLECPVCRSYLPSS
ncbi:hypothetical protein DM01DRAFT_1297822 [Hesseltinella vesiculosa]|uniref:RING-type E3 ubiquitin transferase n=1 Tax=Hesseltinella vesiculosa TaxID=101127 RepID=A0A1X2GY30_9FUNG|nr:hypothetical protein DM01DRAFT_1297822 [Hesseltinella vesiculosa]